MCGIALLLALGQGKRAGDRFAPQETVGWGSGRLLQHTGRWRPPGRPEPGAQLVPTSRVPATQSPARSWWKPCSCESAWECHSGGLHPHSAGPQHLCSDLEFLKPGLERSRPAAWPWVTAPGSGLELDSEPSAAPQAGSRDSQGRPSTAHVYRHKSHSSLHAPMRQAALGATEVGI